MPYKDPKDRKAYNKKYRAGHKQEISDYDKKRRAEPARRQALSDYGKKYRAEHREERLSQQRKYRAGHKQEISARSKRYWAKHREERLAYTRKHQQEIRQKALSIYGGSCACCGESTYEFLGLDHIHGGGTKHRRRIGGGNTFYLWLKRNNYPNGYQVLCHNCNLAKGFYGKCPHKAGCYQ